MPDNHTWSVGHSESADFQNIQDAINTAQSGDTIYMEPGTYTGGININKSITLLGENRDATLITGPVGKPLITIQANDVTVYNFILQNSGWKTFEREPWASNGAILIYNSTNVQVTNNTFIDNLYGVLIDMSSSNISISGNSITGNQDYNNNQYQPTGIIFFSNYTKIEANNITNLFIGIAIGGNYSLINNNLVTGAFKNDNGNFSGSWGGISTLIGKGSTWKNILTISFDVTDYTFEWCNNTIISNTLKGNDFGLQLTSVSNFTIYHNNFYDGGGFGYNAITHNDWDNGYPSGGNYWRCYPEDEFNGPDQNITGSDGISDKPQVINQENIDRYPLMQPFATPCALIIIQ